MEGEARYYSSCLLNINCALLHDPPKVPKEGTENYDAPKKGL